MVTLEQVAETAEEHEEFIVPAAERFDFPGRYSGVTGHPVAMGWFYEKLTQAIFGGMHLDNRIRNARGFDMESTTPDVVNLETKCIYESKSCRWNHETNLLDAQIARYGDLQLQHPDFRLFFAYFSHNVPGIKNYNQSVSHLFSRLAKETNFGLLIPFSMVVGLHNFIYAPDHESLVRIHRPKDDGGESFQACTCLKKSTLAKLFTDPEAVIRELGMSSEEYFLDRLVSPVIRVGIDASNRKRYRRATHFPILKIEDRDHESWLEAYRDSRIDAVPF